MSDILKELKEKESRVRSFMQREKLGAVLLTKQNNFAWFTGGKDNHVVTASEMGVASILITKNEKFLITNNIEAPRIMDEELKNMGFKLEHYPWHDKEAKTDIISSLTDGMEVGSDDGYSGTKDINNILGPLRYSLTSYEIARYRALGRLSSRKVGELCKKIKPGNTEHEVAGMVAESLLSEGITPHVLLIAADERIKKYRHPIPTDKKIKKYVMVVVCARKWGLIASWTRLVHFGRIPDDLRKRHTAVVNVDAAFILNTRPGRVVGDIFDGALRAYRENGFADEWRLHHQGGPTGYAGRDYVGTSGEKQKVLPNQAFAWNPSITGTKSEDTIIALEDKTEVITATPNWPTVRTTWNGKSLTRPDILER